MFLLELYLQNRRAKVEAWERRGEEWVESNKYYSMHDYESRYRKPVFPWKAVFGFLPVVLVVITVVASIVSGIIHTPPKKVDPSNPHDCSVVIKKGDTVAVTYGDFVGSEGVAVDNQGKGTADDCGVNIKLTKSTNTREDCIKTSTDCRRQKNVGEQLYVDSSGNITKTQQ